MVTAAGILFMTPAKECLFLQRGPGGDHPSEWCWPGGESIEGETVEETAVRETKEELGFCPKGLRAVLTRSIYPNRNNSGGPANMVPPEGEPVDYTTFLQRVSETFEPRLNGEHTGWAWAPADNPPEPLHPGAQLALKRLTMDELGIARAIAAGELTSPQHYENLALFAIRISGTGLSYRSAHKEYVWRDEQHYLNDEFLARCNGLPVVWEHPDRSMLDSKEFADRVIGTIMLPYVQGSEVWGVARIYDDSAAEMMEAGQLSTSPGVVFRDPTVNTTQVFEDGTKLLFEGAPSLLDHLAVCELGVWDKKGPPAGVLNENLPPPADERVAAMTDDEKAAAAEKARKDSEEKEREDRVRRDADAGKKLDLLLTHLDSMAQRMDALEMDAKRRHDSEEEEKKREREDKARKDAEEHEAWAKEDAEQCAKDDAEEEKEIEEHLKKGETKEVAADRARKDRRARHDKRRADAEEAKKREEEEERKKADSARADSQLKVENGELVRMFAELKARADASERMLSDINNKVRPVEEGDKTALADSQARWDEPYMSFGLRAPAPMQGEAVIPYRTRLARGMQKHSPQWKDIPLHQLKPELLDIAERQIFADAQVAAASPDDLPHGHLRAIQKPDGAGHMITTFVGKGTFIGALKRPSRNLVGISTKSRE